MVKRNFTIGIKKVLKSDFFKKPISTTLIVALSVFTILMGVSGYLLNTKISNIDPIREIMKVNFVKPRINLSPSPIPSTKPDGIRFLSTTPTATPSSAESTPTPTSTSITITPTGGPTPTTSASPTPKEITVSLNGQVYNDSNCNNVKEDNETGLKDVIIAIFQPNNLIAILGIITSDANGNYSFSKTIQGNELLTIQPVPGVNMIHVPQEITLSTNKTSVVMNISSCPLE